MLNLLELKKLKKIKIYDRITETLVREVFFKFSEELGYQVISSRESFPDFILMMGDEVIRAEAEVLASNFYLHKHSEAECDLIICFKNDLANEISLRILELDRYIEVIWDSETSKLIPRIRGPNELVVVLAFLRENKNKDFSIKEVADAIGFKRGAVGNYLRELAALGKIKLSRIVCKAEMYQYKEKMEGEKTDQSKKEGSQEKKSE